MKIKVDLENCYGINKLEREFDFSNKNVFSVYASNGVMKTSFAKTFSAISKGESPKDEIYPEKVSKCEIKKDSANIDPKEIFVIKPYEKGYHSDNIATLLVNEALKKQYDSEYDEIKKAKENFLKTLKPLSGIKKIEDIDFEVCKVFFHGEKNKFLESLRRVEDEILKGEDVYSEIEYANIFNEKTSKIIENPDFLKNIETYVGKYNELLEKSTFFRKGIFNHKQASDVATQLEKNGFFNAQHSVLLNQKGEIKTKKELEAIIEKEKDSILKDEKLKQEFNKLDKILGGNIDLGKFRDYLSNNPQVAVELLNAGSFKAKLWKSYFKKNEAEFVDLLGKFKKTEETIGKIKKEAQKEEGLWYAVINDFNNKFFVPFKLDVANKIDAMLNNELPKISFKFEKKPVEESLLIDILSQGERRALYILNILFEIEARKKIGGDCLLIVDDIADSFDYKNKYAIIGYLKEISEIPNFYLIILTHNFDFHRSVCSRLDMCRNNKLNAVKHINKIELIEEVYQNSPLKDWISHFDDATKLLASVPMVRNLFEYSGKKNESDEMASFLHIKANTENLTIGDLKIYFEKIFDRAITNKITDTSKKFYELLLETCDNISPDDVQLEIKIILSIAIRLISEKFMISKINDQNFVNNLNSHQTYRLFERYKNDFPREVKKIKLLDRVILMTPENIHLNSFMYEPILDMSSEELRQLYDEIKSI